MSKLAKSNPKSFWKYVKTQYNTKKCDPENISINDMYSRFNDLFGPQPQQNTNNATHDNSYLYDRSEIRNAVFSQNNSKSSGTDHIIAEVFKSAYDIIAPLLVRLYNSIFNEGIFPNSWGEGTIIPIFKEGNPDAKNFRGITLNNIISKITQNYLLQDLLSGLKNMKR